MAVYGGGISEMGQVCFVHDRYDMPLLASVHDTKRGHVTSGCVARHG